ncbi:MAG: fibronectin type III domain-containing protein [Kineosporiaceae bacterium]
MTGIDWSAVDAEARPLAPDPDRLRAAFDAGMREGHARFVRRLQIRRAAALGVVGIALLAGLAARTQIAAEGGDNNDGSPPSSRAVPSTATPTKGSGSANVSSKASADHRPPAAPSIVGVHAGWGRIKVLVDPPSDLGDSRIRRYRAVCTSIDGGVRGRGRSEDGVVVVEGVTAGRTYTCTATAENDSGQGPASLPSDSVTPQGRPGPPTIKSVEPGSGEASVAVAFDPPGDKGGLQIVRYTATCRSVSSGDEKADSAESSPITVRSLKVLETYRCHVVAVNAVGPGQASDDSDPVQPALG